MRSGRVRELPVRYRASSAFESRRQPDEGRRRDAWRSLEGAVELTAFVNGLRLFVVILVEVL